MTNVISSACANKDDRSCQELLSYCACRRRLLDPREWLFVFDMTFANLRPTPTQKDRLRSIAARLKAGEA